MPKLAEADKMIIKNSAPFRCEFNQGFKATLSWGFLYSMPDK